VIVDKEEVFKLPTELVSVDKNNSIERKQSCRESRKKDIW
jgi:hypothetical protein